MLEELGPMAFIAVDFEWCETLLLQCVTLMLKLEITQMLKLEA